MEEAFVIDAAPFDTRRRAALQRIRVSAFERRLRESRRRSDVFRGILLTVLLGAALGVAIALVGLGMTLIVTFERVTVGPFVITGFALFLVAMVLVVIGIGLQVWAQRAKVARAFRLQGQDLASLTEPAQVRIDEAGVRSRGPLMSCEFSWYAVDELRREAGLIVLIGYGLMLVAIPEDALSGAERDRLLAFAGNRIAQAQASRVP